MTRKYTNMLLDAIDDGLLAENIVRAMCAYFSESDIQGFVESEFSDLCNSEEEEEEEEEEFDEASMADDD